MKTLIALLMLSFAVPTFAAEPAICVGCPKVTKVHKEPFKCKKGLEKVVCGGQVRCLAPKAKAEAKPVCPVVEPTVVTKEVVKEVPVPGPVVIKEVVVTKEVVKLVEKEDPWEIMVYGQFGAHWNTNGYPSTMPTQTNLNGYPFNNWGSWNVGTEFHLKHIRMGLRTYVGNNGIGGLVQVFPVQGRLNWYIGAGGAYTQYPFYRPTVPYVQRYFDIQVGTGVEYAFTPHLVGLADLKGGFPIPWTNAPSLTWNDVGNSFMQSQFLVGLGYRF